MFCHVCGAQIVVSVLHCDESRPPSGTESSPCQVLLDLLVLCSHSVRTDRSVNILELLKLECLLAIWLKDIIIYI